MNNNIRFAYLSIHTMENNINRNAVTMHTTSRMHRQIMHEHKLGGQ